MTTTEAKAVEAARRLVEMAHGDIAHVHEYPQYVQVNALAIARAYLALSARVERLEKALKTIRTWAHHANTDDAADGASALHLIEEASKDALTPKAQP